METKFGTQFENTGFWKILKCLIEWLMIICSVGCSGVIIISTIMRYLLVIVNFVLITWAIPYLTDAIVRMPSTTALSIPLFIPRIAILLGLVLMEFYHVYYLIKNFVNFRRIGYFSEPNDYDFFPRSLMEKYPNTGLPDKEEMEARRAAEAAAYEAETHQHGKEEK